MSISLITIAEGEAYKSFVPRWWESVIRMDPMPDSIIIVIGAEDRAGVLDVITEDVPVCVVSLDEPFSNAYFTAGFSAADTDWVGFCGIDDQMLPRAYADIPEATLLGAEIIPGTIVLSNGQVWRGTWNVEALQRHNTLPAHSPVTKELWERVGGFPDIRWSDWGFWLKCAKENPAIYQATEPLAIFDIGDGRETMSGVTLDPAIRARADAELHAFRESL